ncbi:MAG: hypothetical protein K2Z81_13120, partial [Cyanobacteria bacterium]|nr:hypothetical protein [Cyanobacteriota bacterium]
LGDLLFNAGVVNDRDLNDALHDSANMDLTLGFLLVARGLVSRGMVHESLDLLELIKARSLSRGDAGQLLKNAHSRSASLKQVLKDSKIDTKAVSSVNIGTLLVLAEVMNDGEFATARELALLSGNRFIDVVLDNGFASQECLSAAEKLLYLVKQGKMELGDAAERLRKGDFETVVEEKSPAASLVEKEKRVVAKQAESVSASAPASVLNSVPEKLVKVAEPKTVPNASPAAQVGGHIETVQPPQTASHSVPPQKQTKPPQSQSVPAQTQTKPPQSQLQSQPQPASSVPPQTQTEDSHKADSLTATPQSQSDLPTEQALPLDPQEPTTPPVPPASSDEEKASEIPLEIAADEEAAKPVTELPQSPKEEPRRPIDRLELLRKARIITEPQLRGAMRTSAEKNASPVRILFDAGIIDQDDLNVTGHVKKMFDAGDIDLRTAINVIRYCKENSVGFDEGLDNVLAQEYP